MKDLKSYFEIPGRSPFTPLPLLPSTSETGDLAAVNGGGKKEVASEGEENGRTFKVLGNGENRGADLTMEAECDEDILRVLARTRRAILDEQSGIRKLDADRDIVGTSNRFCAHRPGVLTEKKDCASIARTSFGATPPTTAGCKLRRGRRPSRRPCL